MAHDLISNLERAGWHMQGMGGNTRGMVKGNALLTGYDGDLPYDDWWVLCLYADFNDPDSIVWEASHETYGDDIDAAIAALTLQEHAEAIRVATA